MKIYFILTICLFITLLPLRAQIETPPSPVLDQFRNDISPQVEMMNRYGTYPVDLSNGLVDISIPLHTIQTPGGLTMPLNISFHASGLRSTEREGVLGVRWVLAGVGTISRTIKGYPDYEGYPGNGERKFNTKISSPDYTPDFYDLYGTTGPQTVHMSGNNSAFLEGVTDHKLNLDLQRGEYKDTEHDVYSYILPSGKSGKFIWVREDNNTNDELWEGYTMPYEPIQAAPARIIDENGITYQFGEGIFVDKDRNNNITSRYLTSILSQNKKDKITIDYVRYGDRIYTGRQYAMVNCNAHGPTNILAIDPGSDPCGSYMGTEILTHPLSVGLGNLLINGYYNEEREASNGIQEIPFSVRTIRVYSEDCLICTVEFNYQTGIQKCNCLKEIVVKNSLGNIIKNIQFTVKQNREGVKFLDTLSFVDSNNLTAAKTYTFDYYNWDIMPPCGSDRLRFNSDWWGFYSDGAGWIYPNVLAIDTPHTIRQKALGSSGGTQSRGGDKQSRMGSMMVGMIKSICYPTGGKATFEYEGNEVKGGLKMGGLRISNITNRLSSGKIEMKHYEYKPGNAPSYLYPPTDNLIYSETFVDCYASLECQKIAASYPPASNEEWGDYRSFVYQGHFPDSYVAFLSNIVHYDEVAEYDIERVGSVDKTLGKTIYKYTQPEREQHLGSYYENLDGDEFYGNGYHRIRYISPKDFWVGGKLSSKTYYEGDRRIKEVLYDYQIYRKKSVYDLPVHRYRNHFVDIRSVDGNDNTYKRGKYELSMICPDNVDQTFAIKHQEYTIGAEKLVRETENTYYDDNTMTSIVKDIEYDNTYLLPAREEIINSDNIKTRTVYHYPFSGYLIGDVYNKMVSRNCLNFLVGKFVDKGEHSDQMKTEYSVISGGFYPSKKTFSNLGTTLNYHNYTSMGRPVYVSQNEISEKIVYIWSYFQQYPIAEIKNVSYNDVCNALGGESYITELANKISPSYQDYVNLRRIIDFAPDAQITTAKYKPLVGVVEVTDPKGLTTYYEYDALGRLMKSYIQQASERQVIERFDYHYVNQ